VRIVSLRVVVEADRICGGAARGPVGCAVDARRDKLDLLAVRAWPLEVRASTLLSLASLGDEAAASESLSAETLSLLFLTFASTGSRATLGDTGGVMYVL
jgi:hypothetical protein